jgi:diaminopimelate decarboxylase
MDHFTYKNGELFAENVPLRRIAGKIGTPFYCYSRATLERHYAVFADAFSGLDADICYSLKANGNLAVVSTLGLLGAGADVVSGGELKRALTAGIGAQKIVFSGVAKMEKELSQALDAGILQINVESDQELEILNRIAGEKGVTARVAIRVNPDIDALTHAKITTGTRENKFGIEWTRAHEVCARAAAMPAIDLSGLAVHIGSQLLDLEPFRAAYTRLGDLAAMLRSDGIGIRSLDLGGGLGISYDGGPSPSPEDYASVVRETVGGLGCRIILEPGRMIVGNAGVLVAAVVYVKTGASKNFVIIDAGMNDLLRPALYGAVHAVIPAREPPPDASPAAVDVVGPVCESGDTFAAACLLPPMARGELIAFRTAGAYGAVMASSYNARSLPPEVMVDGGDFQVVRERIGISEMMTRETVPGFLDNARTEDGCP